jgi:hypothetical protein
MKDFDLMVNDMVQTQVQIPNDVASILKDYVGGFNTVFNKEEQDENSILMIEDPSQPGSGKMIMDVTSEMGKKAKAKAEEFLRRHIDKQLGRKETQKEPTPPREKSANKILEEQQGSVVDLWNSLYSSTDSKKRNSIVSSILESSYNKQSINPLTEIKFVQREEVDENGEKVMQDFMELTYLRPGGDRTGENAIPISGNYEDWAATGISVHGVDSKKERESSLTAESIYGGTENPFAGTRAGRGTEQPKSNAAKVRTQIRQFFGNSKKSFVKADEDEIMTKLQGALSSLGFTFSTSPGLGFDRVKVTSPDEKTFDFVVGSSTDNSEDLLKWILPKITNNAADVFIESGLDISAGIEDESEETEKKKKLPGT